MSIFYKKINILIIILILLVFLFKLCYNRTTKIEIQGHRGARGNYPENTLVAFKFALDNNIDNLELDLQLTKDNILVIHHDNNTNSNICINGNGNIPIKSLTHEEIKKYDCGSKQNNKFPNQIRVPNEKIPTFKELLDMIRTNYYNRNIKLNVEIKTTKELDTYEEVKKFAETLINIIHDYGLIKSTIIQSFDERALKYVRQIEPNIKTSFLIEEIKIDDKIILLAKSLDVQIISPDYLLLTKENVHMMHTNGFEVLPWTVNDIKDLQKMIEYNVNGIISDYPTIMKDYINRN
jgi:glycerophosphoryl diester phosphodiesterase